MWHLRRPTAPQVRAFLEDQRLREFSYREVGQSLNGSPSGYTIDHNRVQLGVGEATFEKACDALRAWRMFPAGWTQIEPQSAPIATGTTIAMLAHVSGLWWLNACRIVYTIDELEPTRRRFGFAYGTLPAHVETGEERFSIEWLPDDTIWYDLRAFSRPRYWMVRMSKPLARRQQKRFARESLSAMQKAVATS